MDDFWEGRETKLCLVNLDLWVASAAYIYIFMKQEFSITTIPTDFVKENLIVII